MQHLALAPAAALPPGTRLGKYELIRPLAVGGMAEVYLARAHGIEGFQKRVVLKRILPRLAASQEFIAMFLNEARIAAILDHPNIIQVHDICAEAGGYYLTMEYLRGQDVRNLVKHAHRSSSAIPIGCATAIAIGAAAGLHYAHEAAGPDGEPLGIVHRDVSLSNILVSYDGAVKIVDFGIAKARAGDAETQTGTLKGKVAYMSPEQCRGEPLDRRSDIFSLGIVLYEMVTGDRLFAGTNEFAILQSIIAGDIPPPSRRRPDLPAALEAIIMKALSVRRSDRYATAQELERALHDFARELRLDLSAITVGDYLTALFAEEIASEPSDSAVSGRARQPTDDGDPSIIIVDGDPDNPNSAALEVDPGAPLGPAIVTSMFAAAPALATGPEAPGVTWGQVPVVNRPEVLARPYQPPPAAASPWPRLLGALFLLLAGAGVTAVLFASVPAKRDAVPAPTANSAPTPAAVPVPAPVPAAVPAAVPTPTAAAAPTPLPTLVPAPAPAAAPTPVPTPTAASAPTTTPDADPHLGQGKHERKRKRPRAPAKSDSPWDPNSALLPGL